MREDGWRTRTNFPLVKRRPESFRVKLHSSRFTSRAQLKSHSFRLSVQTRSLRRLAALVFSCWCRVAPERRLTRIERQPDTEYVTW